VKPALSWPRARRDCPCVEWGSREEITPIVKILVSIKAKSAARRRWFCLDSVCLAGVGSWLGGRKCLPSES